METRVPAESDGSFIPESLHNLNDADHGNIERISDVDHDGVSEDSLENEDEANSMGALHGSFKHSLPLHVVNVDDNVSSLENSSRPSCSQYDILTLDDVLPIETARARLLQIIIEHFISERVIEVVESSEVVYAYGHQRLSRRKHSRYEGDSKFALPLMYVANLYDTLVRETNLRLLSLDGVREKTIGVALEAAGGLYRRLAKRFPRKGRCSFKRRELATYLETRTRFPELLVQEEKRLRFVVVNGLFIVEKPSTMPVEDAEWFKRLTGRHEVVISASDYKFYCPRHKFRRATSHCVSNVTESEIAADSGGDMSQQLSSANVIDQVNEKHHQQQQQQLPHHSQFLSPNQALYQQFQQSQHAPATTLVHQCAHSSHVADIPQQAQLSTMAQHMAYFPTLYAGPVAGHLHVLPTSPAKFCDECGAPFVKETSKFCSECGAKRLGT